VNVLSNHRSAFEPDRNRTDVEQHDDERGSSPHDFDRVDEADGGFVLRCTCGWASMPSRSAEVVGTAWDGHRRDVGATDW
jgi:hypothetical protein